MSSPSSQVAPPGYYFEKTWAWTQVVAFQQNRQFSFLRQLFAWRWKYVSSSEEIVRLTNCASPQIIRKHTTVPAFVWGRWHHRANAIDLTEPRIIRSNRKSIKTVSYIKCQNLICHRGTKTIVASWHCHPESFCASGKFLRVTLEIALGSFQTVWKISGWSGKSPDSLDIFRMVQKVSE